MLSCFTQRNLEYDNEVYEYYYYNDIADFELGDCVNWTHYMGKVFCKKSFKLDHFSYCIITSIKEILNS